MLLPKKVKVTKDMRFAQHCAAAASQLLTPQQTSALKNAGMQSIFAALRAPVHVNFQFRDYIAKLIGADPGTLQKMSRNPEAQCPDLLVVEELHNSLNGGSNSPEFVVSWQSALQQLHARLVHHGRLDMCSYSPMVLKYMPAMSEQTNRNYFSLWIANRMNIPWSQLLLLRSMARGFHSLHFLSGVSPVGKYKEVAMILTL